jgi:hypothetical protein
MSVLTYIKTMCNDDVSYNYLLNWCAHIIQKLRNPTNVALDLYNPNGNRSFINMLRILLGDKCGNITTNDLLYDYDLAGEQKSSHINNIYAKKRLIIGDEIDGTSTKHVERLKYIITRNYYWYNSKNTP